MSLVLSIFALFFIAFAVIAGVTIVTYFVFFKKYHEKINKSKENDINKGSIKLKYCLDCGMLLDKNSKCKACDIQY